MTIKKAKIDSVMPPVSDNFSDHTALPGQVTFSVLDQEHNGHSVSVAAIEYPGVVRATKTVSQASARQLYLKGPSELSAAVLSVLATDASVKTTAYFTPSFQQC